ncbi:kinase-like domain-containing protein [Dissophora ornata]|nr:kinase-like domain-containing protein [Dissophora ornata]
MKTVAIKKIPLSTLTDNGRGDGSRDQGPTQADVDYFISCIADHNDYETEYEDGESEDEELSDGSSDSGAKYHQNESAMPNQPQRHRRSIRSSVINTMGGNGGLDQVVKCLGCYQTDTELWLSLEFCGGGSVADLIHLSDGPLIESEIGWIMSQILQGLAYLHSKGHVHGDIKAGNILLTVDGRVKLGGSGSVMNHKEGAGKRKRRRRSLTMSEFPASWLAPESNPSSPTSPSGVGAIDIINDHDNGVDSHSRHHSQTYFQWTPEASAETDVWALGVACIELSQGRPPRPEMPILALFGEQRLVGQQQASGNSVSFEGGYSGGIGNGNSTFAGWESVQTEPFGAAGMGMSEEMWSFIAKCLTPEPEARPSVHDLLQDPFIVQHSELSAELLTRILRMMDFIDQCATISSDTAPLINSSSSLALSLPPSTPASSSLTLSPLKALHMIDTKLDEASIGPWLIPMVLPRVDSVYDESSFFDDSGLPVPPPEPDAANHVSDWKHQRISHPVVKQALMCEQAGYMIFRHSRSPSLATIVESHLEEDTNSSNMDLGFELETELTDDFEEEEEDDEGDNELSVEYESEGSPFLGENGSRIPCEWLVA